MPWLEGIRVQNFRSLKDVTLGRTIERPYEKDPLPRFSVVIGPNGCGKSSLMDVFGFIGDCLREGVEAACNKPHRGGFSRLRTQGARQPIRFEIYYKQTQKALPISYTLAINAKGGIPFVEQERLRQRRKGEKAGQPYSFLNVTKGQGQAWAGEATEAEEGKGRTDVRFQDPQTLGISTLGNLKDHPRIAAFKEFLEGWYLSYFLPDKARVKPRSGAQKHLDREGGNLANYVQYMYVKHREKFGRVLADVARKIPGILRIEPEESPDGYLLLRFFDRGYDRPFYVQDMSDGTLKMFAYLMLLEDPEPFPFMGIEEPENGLHHQVLESLALLMQEYAENGPQVLATTHSPFFVDALSPEQVWILEKDEHGHATAVRAADIPSVGSLYDQDIPMGTLWYRNHFGRGNP
ncbi:MAG: AAA family ATPase [Thermodesulfobacteriota bacterium]